MNSWIDVRTADGSLRCYLARPSRLPAPCVVVLHEIFGVNDDMRQTCDNLAAKGFFGLAPELFWRTSPGLAMTDQSEAEWQRGMALYTAYDFDRGVADVAATVEVARGLDGASGQVGLKGYCMGGLLAFLASARSRVDASVVYHGSGIEHHLAEMPASGSPLLMHIGEDDEYIPRDAQRHIAQAMATAPAVSLFLYPSTRHAFARHGGIHYDAAAAALANSRTDEFFAQHLHSRSAAGS